MEVFCGSARLTKALRARGLDAWGVDWKGGRLQPESPAILMLDLRIPGNIRRLERLLDHPNLVWVHFAPPCGTCSRARLIRPGPPQLRSEEFPEGLPYLAERFPKEALKVKSANELYEAMLTLITKCIAKRVRWTLENPFGIYALGNLIHQGLARLV